MIYQKQTIINDIRDKIVPLNILLIIILCNLYKTFKFRCHVDKSKIGTFFFLVFTFVCKAFCTGLNLSCAMGRYIEDSDPTRDLVAHLCLVLPTMARKQHHSRSMDR